MMQVPTHATTHPPSRGGHLILTLDTDLGHGRGAQLLGDLRVLVAGGGGVRAGGLQPPGARQQRPQPAPAPVPGPAPAPGAGGGGAGQTHALAVQRGLA